MPELTISPGPVAQRLPDRISKAADAGPDDTAGLQSPIATGHRAPDDRRAAPPAHDLQPHLRHAARHDLPR